MQFHIIRVDFNIDAIINQRINIDRGKGSMPACIRIKRGNTHQTMHPVFSFQIPKGKLTIDLKGTGFNARSIARLIIEFSNFKTLFLRIHDIHAHEHFRPILRFGTTCSRIDFYDAGKLIFFPTEHVFKFQLIDFLQCNSIGLINLFWGGLTHISKFF